MRALIVAVAIGLAGCAGSATRALVADGAIQSAVGQAAIARAIESTPDPVGTARAVRALAQVSAVGIDGATVAAAIRARFGYAELPVSEQLLIDALAAAIAADLSAAAAGRVPAAAEPWRRAALSAADAVIARG